MRSPRTVLGQRLVLLTVAASSALAVLITGIQLFVEYRRDLADINTHFTIIGQSYLPSIEETVWLLDKQRLETLLEGISRLPDFRYAAVSDGDIFIAAKGEPSGSLLTRRFELMQEYRGKRVHMGTLLVGASLEALELRLWKRAGLVLVGNAMKSGLVALFMLVMIDRLVVRRLRHISQQATSYRDGHGWNPVVSRSFRTSRQDEISELGAALDAMSLRVEQTLADLNRLNAELESRVAERTRDLAAARDEADRSNRAKSEFLSSMSHELRTPLNAILGFGQLLQIDPGLGPSQRDQVGEMLSAGHHLLELINDVLDLARIESGHTDLRMESVAIGPLLDECAALARPLMMGRSVNLTIEPVPVSSVHADRTRLKQVLLNLLSNAAKYNREHGWVRVTAAPEADGSVRISVRDSGVGIPAHRLTELFQPFNRLGAEHTGVDGTGIGLVISERLVTMMGGRLGVDSEPGKGSTFALVLPSASADYSDVAAQADRAALAVPAGGARQKLLYVEDNPADLKLVSQVLAMRPHADLLTTQNAAHGLELARAHQPDLILLGVSDEVDQSGNLLRQLQADERLRHVPVIAITATGCTSELAGTSAAGCVAVLTKPLEVLRFLDVMDRFLPAPA